MQRALVFYDEDCGFCRWMLALLLRWDRNLRLRPVGLRSPEADRELASVRDDTRMASWHLLNDGRLYSAGAALAPVFDLLPGGRPFAALARLFPRLTSSGYRWVAEHRSTLAKPIPRKAMRRATERIAAHDSPREPRV